MATERGRKWQDLVVALIEEEWERWHWKQRSLFETKEDHLAGPGRPMDSDIIARGKAAYKIIAQTLNTQRGTATWPLYERWYEMATRAFEQQNWEYLIRFNELQPWHKKWKGREAELVSLLPNLVASHQGHQENDGEE